MGNRFGILLWLWSMGKRFGPLEDPFPPEGLFLKPLVWYLFFYFRVRRSSTWSVQQMLIWLSLSAGAAPLIRTRCSLVTRWKSATSVLWSKDKHFSFLQVIPESLQRGGWEGQKKGDSDPATNPAHNLVISRCDISFSHQLRG